MQSLLNLNTTFGLPLCISGITHPKAFSKQVADHDQRREAMKRNRSQGRERFGSNREMGSQRSLEKIKDGEIGSDLDDLSCNYLGCTAKAA